MKGFEISINDAAPILAASDDIVTIIISIGYSNGNYMHVGGMDSSHYYLKWFGKQPKISDKMKVRICEIDTVSPYYERFPSDREEMRKEYDELKKQLEEEQFMAQRQSDAQSNLKKKIDEFLGNRKWIVILGWIFISFVVLYTYNRALNLITAVIGMLCLYQCIRITKKYIIQIKIYKWIERDSFGIYLFHPMIIYVLFYCRNIRSQGP